MTAKRKMAFLNLLFLRPPRRNTTRRGNTARGIWYESPDFTGGFSEVEVIGSCPQITQLEAKWPFVETRLREGMLASLMAFY
ncbi:hypothetical protein CXU14_09430 [Akkermansia muciniphila]|nr:hypothetical protein CXU14_09430 [Akkermansia muciniphila]